MIGVIADLCVYLFRWKPFRVWMSFFRRNRNTEEPEEEETSFRPAVQREKPVRETYSRIPEPTETEEEPEEPDFSQWEQQPDEPAREESRPAREPAVVTNAGYVVPADSPYRRPETRDYIQSVSEPEPDYGPEPVADDSREADTSAATSRRRRRISVSDLFSDPEEEMKQFDAPQQFIDSSKAYHRPVYPRGWNKSEDDGK